MAQRKYRIFMVNPPNKEPNRLTPQKLNSPQRDTPIATLAHLNRETLPTTQSLPSGETKPCRRSMFIRRNYKRSLSSQPEKYSYNLNHISKEGDFLNCNVLDCYIVDREGENLKEKEDKVERESQQQMKKLIEKVQQSKKKRQEWKKGNVAAEFQESTVLYHAQFRPYQENQVNSQENHGSNLQNSPQCSPRKRVNIFEKESNNRPNSFLNNVRITYQTNPEVVDPERRRAISLNAVNGQSPSFLAVMGCEPRMSTIREQTSEISSKINEVKEENSNISPAVRKLLLKE